MQTLIKTNLNTMFGYARFLTGDRDKAMDLVQDSVIKALKNAHQYNHRHSFKSWIFTVMRNLYINQIRRRIVLPEISESDLSREDSTPYEFRDEKSNTEELTDPLLKERIAEALDALSNEFREVVYFIEIEGFSYEEVAKMLDIPVGTVMSRIHRARRHLKKALVVEAGEILEFKVNRHA